MGRIGSVVDAEFGLDEGGFPTFSSEIVRRRGARKLYPSLSTVMSSVVSAS
jgi:hypothetical protein